jgi:transposase
MVSFQRSFLKEAKHIAFDVSHIISNSQKMDLNFQGYNSKRDFDPQVNTLYLFSTDIKMPAFYRILPGNISGVKALKLTLDEAGLQDCVVIGDKGFYSQSNVSKLEELMLHYILPMRRNSSYADYSRLRSREYSECYDGHFIYKKRSIYYYTYKHDGRDCVMFYDPSLQQSEATDYLIRIDDKIEGYSMEGFQDRELTFGTFLVITNLENASPKDIYLMYKTRMEVETMFDALKNILQADASYMQSNESFKAWMFINHIALMLYYRLYNLLKEKDLLNKYSPKDILLSLSLIHKVRINRTWQLAEVTSKTEQLIKKLGITVP